MKKEQIKELFDLEIDEVSAVDSPAIGEQIYVIKSMSKINKEDNVSETKEENKKTDVKKVEEETKEEETKEEETKEEETKEEETKEEIIDFKKRISVLEKNMGDVSTMLSRSLELHDVAATALNEIIMFTLNSLDLLVSTTNSEVSSEEEKSLFTEINESIKSVRADVIKAGAKISASRMVLLREISEKLVQLIASVTNEAKTENKTKLLDEIQISLKSVKEELGKEINSSVNTLREDFEGKFKNVSDKIDNIEQSGGASSSIGIEEEEGSSISKNEQEKSLFSDIVGLSEITKNIERKRRNLIN